jgi:AraC-like DNA-binding protein
MTLLVEMAVPEGEPSEMAIVFDSIREWRERSAWRRLDFRPLSDWPFRASVIPTFEELHIARTAISPGVAFRDREMVRDGDDSFWLLLSQSTRLEIEHLGRDLRLGSGDATLTHTCETGSFGSRRHFGYIGVLLPRSEIAGRGVRLDGGLMRYLPRQSDALQLLRGYIQTLEKGKISPFAEARETICRHVIDLVALAVTAHRAIGESSLSAVAAAHLSTALHHLDVRFWDPELSVVAVTREMGISPRYLQRLLETSGTSFTARVTELRLQRAFTLLTEARDNKLPISDIAFDAGFTDISHFNRLFRSRFGDTPRGVRGLALR